MKLKCVLLDDEPLALKVLEKYASETDRLEIAGTFSNPVTCLDFLEKENVDLLFMDIDMPRLDGFGLLETLSKKPIVILTTAHPEYAVKSYELEVTDYLVKPIAFPRFLQAVNKAAKLVETQANAQESRDHVFLKIDKKKLQKVYYKDILVVESLKDYIKIITDKGRFVVHQTLSSFTEELPSDQFLRIHRSFTISIDRVDVVEGNSVEIAGKRYTIGRSYLNEAKKVILQLENSEEEESALIEDLSEPLD